MGNVDSAEMQTIKEYIDQRDTAVEQKIKLWIITSVMAQIITLLPIIFFLGGIYQSANASFDLLTANQTTLSETGKWRQERELWELGMQSWAESNGYQPPKK